MSIDEFKKEIERLIKKKMSLLQKGKYVQAGMIDAQISSINAKLECMISKEQTTLHELLKDQGEDVKQGFEVYTTMLIVALDMADWAAVSLNSMLNKFAEGKVLTITQKVAHIRDCTNDMVALCDRLSNQETAEDYGNLSDRIIPIVQTEIEKHTDWLRYERNSEIKYIE